MTAAGAGSSALGRYEVHGEIASGGMARVHFGRLVGDEGFSRAVAIKRMHPALARDPRFSAMFRDEALLASRIRHPNVVATVDVVAERNDVLIVMEYVRGLPLSALLSRAAAAGEPVSVAIATAIMTGMLAGLHAAHEARGPSGVPLSIVHRDVSPQNVLVDVDGVARVMDFGIAKASAQLHVTLEGEIKGKLSYMAPEQLLSRPLDRRADVFASGVVLYSMLAGRPLFGRGEIDETTDRILKMAIPPLVSVRPDVGDALSAVVAKALEREPAARFATARDFQIALESAVDRASSPRMLGTWVERLAGDVIAARDKEIARIEGAGTDDASADADAPLEITSTDAPTLEMAAGEAASPAASPSPAPSPAPAPIVSAPLPPHARVPTTVVVLAAGAALALAVVLLVKARPTQTDTSDVPSQRPGVTEDRPATQPTQALPTADPVVVTPSPPPTSSAAEPEVSALVENSANPPSGVSSALPRAGTTNKPPGYFPSAP